MSDQQKNEKHISRRGLLPLLGSAFLIPLFGFGNTVNDKDIKEEVKEEEYQTLLKPDGTTVKVKVSTIKKSKVVEKNISNSSFLNWLGKKL
jgi:hypothetical protein